MNNLAQSYINHVLVKKFFTFLLVSLFLLTSSSAKCSDSTGVKKNRLIPLVAGVNVAYAGALVYLSSVWYSQEERTSFHFFNDWDQWNQMDKIGHLTTSFHEGLLGSKVLVWAGVPEKKAVLIGAVAGFVYQAPIEVLDGFSPTYGASMYDLAANALGSGLLAGQYLAWNEIRVQPKFSFHPTRYAEERPDVLGNVFEEEVLKDYNGQTYWLSANISSFIKNRNIPKWLNISLGYSTEGMVYARKSQNISMGYKPYRQYFLSFDIDFNHVKIKKRWVKILLYPLNIIHIPFPAFEYSRKGFKFHPLYF